MKTIAIIMMLAASTSVAQDNSDAPVILDAGQPSPTRGVLLPESKAIEAARAAKACTAERDELRKSAGLAWWVPVVIGVVALGAGVGIGVGVGKGAPPK